MLRHRACFPPAPYDFVVGWASRSGYVRYLRTNSKGPGMILQIIHLIDIYSVVLVLSIVMLGVAVYVLGVANGWRQHAMYARYVAYRDTQEMMNGETLA